MALHVVIVLMRLLLHYCLFLLLGTRIIYDRKMLLQLRDSPYSRTPPTRLPPIPDIIAEGSVAAVPQGTKSPLTIHSESNLPYSGLFSGDLISWFSGFKHRNQKICIVDTFFGLIHTNY